MNEPNPFATLQQMAGGYCLPRCLHVVADLGVADALDDAPQTAAHLAAAVGADADALGRVLRLLSAHGVFTCTGGGFAHSPASRLLRADHPQSMRAFVRMFGLRSNWDIFGALDHSVRTGQPAADKVLPNGFWGHLAQHPEAGAIFSEAMSDKAQAHVPLIVAAYDWSRFERVGDIGGGRGHLLQAVLGAAPKAGGVLFDLPQMVAQSTGLASARLVLQPGDFFKDALPACDAYLLMEVIHDWGDAESVAILKAIRKAARPRAKLLLIEQIVPDDPGPHWTKLLDIHMMAFFAARQRTRQEYEALLRSGGFTFDREIETDAGISILEATAA
ncbi:MAG TPA: methyltransferase [Pirellulaceae bacterium]|nr:methyltransferase [Pirellulaceae bacterium]